VYVAVLHLHDQSHYIKELSSKIQPSAVVRDLGLHLDTELSMKHHVVKVAVIYYYHTRRVRQIRRRVGQEVTTHLALAMVISRLDYCNAALAALPKQLSHHYDVFRT